MSDFESAMEFTIVMATIIKTAEQQRPPGRFMVF